VLLAYGRNYVFNVVSLSSGTCNQARRVFTLISLYIFLKLDDKATGKKRDKNFNLIVSGTSLLDNPFSKSPFKTTRVTFNSRNDKTLFSVFLAKCNLQTRILYFQDVRRFSRFTWKGNDQKLMAQILLGICNT